MKSLVDKIINNNLSVNLRNLFNIKPVNLSLRNLNKISISDAFLWRTDNNFKTIFHYTDILSLFYKIQDSFVEIHFYSKKNEKIKIIKFDKLDLSNKLLIDSKYLNGICDYGVFYIYHFTNQDLPKDIIISNRCYSGYSKNENLYSYIHGNTLAKYCKIDNNENESNYKSNIIKKTITKNQIYKVQKLFKNFDKSELFFANPTSEIVNFSINEDNYKLTDGCSVLIDVSKYETIIIKSNCLFLRPIIFSYKNQFMDVHHG